MKLTTFLPALLGSTATATATTLLLPGAPFTLHTAPIPVTNYSGRFLINSPNSSLMVATRGAPAEFRFVPVDGNTYGRGELVSTTNCSNNLWLDPREGADGPKYYVKAEGKADESKGQLGKDWNVRETEEGKGLVWYGDDGEEEWLVCSEVIGKNEVF